MMMVMIVMIITVKSAYIKRIEKVILIKQDRHRQKDYSNLSAAKKRNVFDFDILNSDDPRKFINASSK